MKRNLLIIILSIIGLSINTDYDLVSGVSKSFTSLSSSNIYTFFIKAEIGQTVVFTISKSDDYLPSSQKIYFYEYSSRNPKSYEYHSSGYPSYHYYSFSKTIYPSYSTTYVAMEITPDSTISNIEIKATVSGTSSKQDIDNAVGLVGLSLLAVILIPILVFICIIVAIICVCCRKRDNVVYINNPAINPNPPVQPLYPTNPPPQYIQTNPPPQYIQNNPPPQYMINNPPPQYIPPPQ